MKRVNYRSTFWLKRKHAACQRRVFLNPMVTHAMLMRWKPAQRRMGRGTQWFFMALFGVERWWEFRQWDKGLFLP